jgi:hypothetical protein
VSVTRWRAFLALELVGERRHRQQQFVGGVAEGAFAILEVEEHAHTSLDDLFECVRRLDSFTAQTRLFRHDEDGETRTRFQRVHHAEESGARGELCTGYSIIDVYLVVGDNPALSRRVGLRMVDLTYDAARVTTNTSPDSEPLAAAYAACSAGPISVPPMSALSSCANCLVTGTDHSRVRGGAR